MAQRSTEPAAAAYNASHMPDAKAPRPDLDRPAAPRPAATVGGASCNDEAMICERCGQAEMYRMHAVWRCPACGFKTDCCGW
jgi:hypothetical protein